MRQKLRFFTIIAAAAFFAGSVLGAGNPEPGDYGTMASEPGDYEAEEPEPGDYEAEEPEPGDYEAGEPEPGDYEAGEPESGGYTAKASVSGNAPGASEEAPDGQQAEGESLPGSVSSNDAEPGGAVPGEAIPGAASGPVFSVAVPENLDFVMDPYELAGQGSIWSQEYCFINRGSTSVRIYLGRLRCVASDNVVIVEGAEQAEGSGKRAALWLRMGNGDTVIITESDSAYELTLAPQEAFPFWISGKISVSDRWESGDISLSLWYRLEAP